MDLDGERHAGCTLEKDRLVLEPLGAEDEVGERLVRDHAVAAEVSLSEIDGCGCIFRRSVLLALEGEVDEQRGRCVASRRSAARRS